MEMSLSLVLFVLVVPFMNCQADKLMITPAHTKLLMLNGGKLELTCIYERTGAAEELNFYKDNVLITEGMNGFNLGQKTSQVIDLGTRDARTLTKNVTTLADDGVYKCSAGTSNTEIQVDVFTVTTENGELPLTSGNTTIACRATDLSAAHSSQYDISWQHDGKTLTDGDKYSIFANNGSVFIKNTKRDDMGEYQCTFVFFPNSTTDRHEVKPLPPIVNAGPAIVSHDNNKNMVQGDDLELKCEVSGYPMPTVTWFKDNIKMNATTRIHFLEYKGANGKLKIFSLEDGDEGFYKCLAENIIPPNNATAEMRIRVKDKLAALWPFLGIVAEVIVLCVIILVYEKRRSKKLAAEEQDNVDANEDNTPDHKDVRHRRT